MPEYVVYVRSSLPGVHPVRKAGTSTVCGFVVRSERGGPLIGLWREATAEEVATGAPCVMCERRRAEALRGLTDEKVDVMYAEQLTPEAIEAMGVPSARTIDELLEGRCVRATTPS